MNSKDARIFIAIKISSKMQRHIKKIQDDLKTVDADIKWVEPLNMHLTLNFIGNASLEKIQTIKKQVRQVVKTFDSFAIKSENLKTFSKNQKPSIIYLSVRSRNAILSVMAKKIDAELESLGFKKERRLFFPHITIGRIKSPRNIQPLLKILKNYKISDDLFQAVHNVTLIKSQLRPSGPTYHILDSFCIH